MSFDYRVAFHHVTAGARLYIKHLVKKEAAAIFIGKGAFKNNADKMNLMAFHLISTGLSLLIGLNIPSI